MKARQNRKIALIAILFISMILTFSCSRETERVANNLSEQKSQATSDLYEKVSTQASEIQMEF